MVTLDPRFGDLNGKSVALYAFDTVKVSKYVELNGGLRFDRFDVDGVTLANTGLVPTERLDEMVSWRGGLVVKPKEEGSIYFSYATSLSPSLEGLSYNTANTAIEPEKTYNLELGSKWDLIDERLSVNGAIFRVEKTNARTPGILPGDPAQVLQGRQRVQGIELGASGGITRALRVFGAYTYSTPRSSNLTLRRRSAGGFRTRLAIRSIFGRLTCCRIGSRSAAAPDSSDAASATPSTPGKWTLTGCSTRWPVPGVETSRPEAQSIQPDQRLLLRPAGRRTPVPGAGRSILVSAGFRF